VLVVFGGGFGGVVFGGGVVVLVVVSMSSISCSLRQFLHSAKRYQVADALHSLSKKSPVKPPLKSVKNFFLSILCPK